MLIWLAVIGSNYHTKYCGMTYFATPISYLKEPIRRVSYSGFDQVPELIHILLLVPKCEATIKYFDPISGEEVENIVHRHFWHFIHPNIDVNQVNAVRDCGEHYVVKYLLSTCDDLSKISKLIDYSAFEIAKKYSLEYSYEL